MTPFSSRLRASVDRALPGEIRLGAKILYSLSATEELVAAFRIASKTCSPGFLMLIDSTLSSASNLRPRSTFDEGCSASAVFEAFPKPLTWCVRFGSANFSSILTERFNPNEGFKTNALIASSFTPYSGLPFGKASSKPLGNFKSMTSDFLGVRF